MINKLKIYLEGKKKKNLVGELERIENGYQFSYDSEYYYSENPLQIGPGLELEKQIHVSKEMFSVFQDRIPSRKNAAYIEYCKSVGIDPKETDEMILLLKLGSKGPSAFVIESDEEVHFTGEDLKKFREGLNVSLRDFAILFDVSLSSIQRIESGRSAGRDVLKRIELYAKFIEAAEFEIYRNRKHFTDFYIEDILKRLGKVYELELQK